MTDLLLDDGAFERALRAALDDLAPDRTPDSLRAAVAAVPLRRGRGRATRGRMLFAAMGMAAAVVVAVAGLAVVTGPSWSIGVLAPDGTPPPASPTPGTETFVFRVVPADGSTATKAQVTAVDDAMAARLRAYGIGTFSSSAADDRITLEVPMPPGAGSREAIRALLGTTGVFSVGQPVATPPEPGDRVDGPPLLTGEDVTSATAVTDQAGVPTLELTLTGSAAAALADATSAHIGEYLPIALDGVAIVAPVIQAEIPGGQILISFSSDDTTTAARLAAILQSGPLPQPVEAVTP